MSAEETRLFELVDFAFLRFSDYVINFLHSQHPRRKGVAIYTAILVTTGTDITAEVERYNISARGFRLRLQDRLEQHYHYRVEQIRIRTEQIRTMQDVSDIAILGYD